MGSGILIDWDNYEVIEADDYTPQQLCDTIEDVREAMDHLAEARRNIPDEMVALLQTLTDMEE